MKFLIDYNLKGQAILLWGTIAAEGWTDFVPISFVSFETVGLFPNSNDRTVWRCAQANQMAILTDNRNDKGKDSLESTIQEENTLQSMPVVTVSSKEKLDESSYRERCTARLIEMCLDPGNFKGVGRLFIP